jgi:hypothetical protein
MKGSLVIAVRCSLCPHTPWEGSGLLEGPVLALVVQQGIRMLARGCPEFDDPSEHDEVIAGVVFGPDRAVEPGQAPLENRVSPSCGAPLDAGPLIGASSRELVLPARGRGH